MIHKCSALVDTATASQNSHDLHSHQSCMRVPVALYPPNIWCCRALFNSLLIYAVQLTYLPLYGDSFQVPILLFLLPWQPRLSSITVLISIYMKT